jgi:hypothetical protein
VAGDVQTLGKKQSFLPARAMIQSLFLYPQTCWVRIEEAQPQNDKQAPVSTYKMGIKWIAKVVQFKLPDEEEEQERAEASPMTAEEIQKKRDERMTATTQGVSLLLADLDPDTEDSGSESEEDEAPPPPPKSRKTASKKRSAPTGDDGSSQTASHERPRPKKKAKKGDVPALEDLLQF